MRRLNPQSPEFCHDPKCLCARVRVAYEREEGEWVNAVWRCGDDDAMLRVRLVDKSLPDDGVKLSRGERQAIAEARRDTALELHERCEMTYREVGKHFDVSASRAGQMIRRARRERAERAAA